jgi:RNA polymerase sigma factor (sigma-70 family)
MTHGPLHTVLRQLRRIAAVPGASELSDGQLLERFARQRDEAAFATLVRRHGPLVLGVCWRGLRQAEDAEDAFQATFLVLARKAGSIRWQASIANWLYEVASRVTANVRGASARRRRQERQVVEIPPVQTRPEPDDRELGRALDEELRRLPERYRAPLLLCYLEGQTRDEAAQQLRCPLGTLKHRLERGREMLRRRLSRRGVTLSATLLAAALAHHTAGAGVPIPLAAATLQAAVHFAAAKKGGGISGTAATLAEGVLRGMVLTKWKLATALVLALGLLAAGAGLLPRPEAAAPPAQPAAG